MKNCNDEIVRTNREKFIQTRVKVTFRINSHGKMVELIDTPVSN